MTTEDGRIEGVDYTREGILNLRREITRYRDDAMKDWPRNIPYTVALTHVIALLAHFAEKADSSDT